MKAQRLLKRVLQSPANVATHDMVHLVQAFGFQQVRQKGSHMVFSHPSISELINLQDVRGQVKPYQVQQFLRLVEHYDLRLEER